MAVKPRPDGYHTVTPYLVVDGAARVIDFLKQVFNAQDMMRLAAPGGIIGHADLRIGDSIATRIEDVTPEELRRRGEEMMRNAGRD
jgi:PhnB protein